MSEGSGAVKPSSLAVFRLITSSNLVGLLDRNVGGAKSFFVAD
jgi:hypothetical protein